MKPNIIILNFILTIIAFATAKLIIFTLIPHGPKHAALAITGTIITILFFERTYRAHYPKRRKHYHPPNSILDSQALDEICYYCPECDIYEFASHFKLGYCPDCDTKALPPKDLPNTPLRQPHH